MPEVRGHLMGEDSLLPPCGLLGLNPGHQALYASPKNAYFLKLPSWKKTEA